MPFFRKFFSVLKVLHIYGHAVECRHNVCIACSAVNVRHIILHFVLDYGNVMKFYIRLYFISRFFPNVDCGDPLDKTALSDYTVYV